MKLIEQFASQFIMITTSAYVCIRLFVDPQYQVTNMTVRYFLMLFFITIIYVIGVIYTDRKNKNNMTQLDEKDTANKLKYDLVEAQWIESMAKVMTFGSAKYTPGTWRKGDPNNYLAATFRHIQAYRMGEIKDPESNLPHLYHAMTNLGILISLTQPENENNTKANGDNQGVDA